MDKCGLRGEFSSWPLCSGEKNMGVRAGERKDHSIRDEGAINTGTMVGCSGLGGAEERWKGLPPLCKGAASGRSGLGYILNPINTSSFICPHINRAPFKSRSICICLFHRRCLLGRFEKSLLLSASSYRGPVHTTTVQIVYMLYFPSVGKRHRDTVIPDLLPFTL